MLNQRYGTPGRWLSWVLPIDTTGSREGALLPLEHSLAPFALFRADDMADLGKCSRHAAAAHG